MKHWFSDLYASIDAMRLDEFAAGLGPRRQGRGRQQPRDERPAGGQGRHRLLLFDHRRDQASPGERRRK